MSGVLERGSRSESDPGQYSRLVASAWDNCHEQLTPGEYGASLDFLASPGAVLYREHIGGASRLTGALRDGLFAFGVMCQRSREQGRWWGAGYPEKALICVEPGGELDLSLPEGNDKFVAVLPVDSFRARFEALTGGEPDFLGKNGHFLKTSRAAMRELQAAFGRAMQSAALADGVTGDGEELADFLVTQFVECACPAEPVTLKPSQRHSLVQRALEMVDEDLPGLPIESICVRLRCSRRTLGC